LTAESIVTEYCHSPAWACAARSDTIARARRDSVASDLKPDFIDIIKPTFT